MCRLLILILCLLPVQAFAGYEALVLPQVSQFVQVQGVDGLENWPNPAANILPDNLFCKPEGFARHSTDAAKRTVIVWSVAGQTTDAEIFTTCPQLRKGKADEIRAEGARKLSSLASPYTTEERESWPTQQKEAEEWQKDSNCKCDFIRSMSTAREIPLSTMVGKIMENVSLFRIIAGQILGKQQNLLDQVDAVTTISGLEAIKW